MGMIVKDDRWRIPDALWEKMELLLPKPKDMHPLGCHRPRVPDRNAMNAILFVLRTGCQWNALDRTHMCLHSSAHRRFMEWTEAGVFTKFWKHGLLTYDKLKGIDWRWLSMDGAMAKAPLGGKKKPVQVPSTEPSVVQSAACSLTQKGFLLPLQLMALTVMT